MQQLLDTGMHKCVRQYSMEIHLPSPLASHENFNRCRLIYKLLRKLNDDGWRLYNTTDNVRYEKSRRPDFNQRILKASALKGHNVPILWETSFVNFDVEGPCYPYL